MCGSIAKNDALAKARGEPTHGFHNIQPNYSNPEIIAAIADKKAGRSTKFYDTGVANIWQQYSDKESTPPVLKSSPPSGGPTRLGIRRSTSASGRPKRSTSTRKRSGVTGRSRSKRKAFSRG
jgi:hypothetical protein